MSKKNEQLMIPFSCSRYDSSLLYQCRGWVANSYGDCISFIPSRDL